MLLDSQLPDGTPLKVPGIVPKLSETPGGLYRPAPPLGQDTEDTLNSLGISAEQQADWQARGLIAKSPKRH